MIPVHAIPLLCWHDPGVYGREKQIEAKLILAPERGGRAAPHMSDICGVSP